MCQSAPKSYQLRGFVHCCRGVSAQTKPSKSRWMGKRAGRHVSLGTAHSPLGVLLQFRFAGIHLPRIFYLHRLAMCSRRLLAAFNVRPFGTYADLPGYDALTFTLMPVGYTAQRSVQVSGFTDIGLLTPLCRLVYTSCSSGQRFAFGFLQISSRPEHPCRSANSSPCRASRGLSPPSECALPGAPKKKRADSHPRAQFCRSVLSCLHIPAQEIA